MWEYENVRCEAAGRWVPSARELTHPDLCRREVEGEAERRRLVEHEGALFVPLSLTSLCLRLVSRLSTVEAALWEAVEHHRVPAGLVDAYRSFQASRKHQAHARTHAHARTKRDADPSLRDLACRGPTRWCR
jgi:ribosomal protein L28